MNGVSLALELGPPDPIGSRAPNSTATRAQLNRHAGPTRPPRGPNSTDGGDAGDLDGLLGGGGGDPAGAQQGPEPGPGVRRRLGLADEVVDDPDEPLGVVLVREVAGVRDDLDPRAGREL